MNRNILEHRYVKSVLAAWSRDPACRQTAPLPLPGGVEASAVCDLFLAHHLQVLAEPFLPAEARTLGFLEGVASSRERTAFLLLELERILPAVTWSACRPVVLKGAALSLQNYPRPDQRWFLDLDILVPRGQVDEVCRRLEAVGYRPYAGGRDPLFYERHHLHRMLLGPQGSCVEVHWDLTLPASLYGFDVAGVFNRAREHPIGRQTMLTASPVDQVLHLAYQNIADGFVDLKRVCDLELLVRGLTPEEKLYLVKESLRTQMSGALWLSLHMVKQLLGTDAFWEGAAAMAPGWMTTRTLRGLDVAHGLLERKGEKVDGYTALLHLLMVPRQWERFQESRRFIWRGEAELMDRGHRADDLPGLGSRLRLSLFFLKTFLNLGGKAVMALVRG